MSSNDEFTFISWQPSHQPSAAEKFQIRSLCMRGKNKRAGSRRSVQQAKREALGAKKGAPSATAAGRRSTNDNIAFQQHVASERGVSSVQTRALVQYYDWDVAAPRALPLLVQLDPAMTQMAKNAQRAPDLFLQQLTLFSRVTTTACSAEHFVEFVYANQIPLPPLDDGLVAGVMFVNSFVHDLSHQGSMTEPTRSHLARTLNLLNKKLAKENAYLEDSTVQSIVFLAIAAGAIGDVDALKAHLSGLQRIFRLRRDSPGFSPLAKLNFTMEAIDLAWAMRFGGDPYLLDTPLFNDHVLPHSPATLQKLRNQFPFLSIADPELVLVFEDLHHLTAQINKNAGLGKKFRSEVFVPARSSVQGRLLRLERRLTDPLDNVLCLSMMTFMLSLFCFPASQSAPSYLAGRLHDAIGNVEVLRDTPEFGTWLLLMAAVSIVDPKEPWLQAAWSNTVDPKASWEEVRKQLIDVVWIKSIHDEPGKFVFRRLQQRPTTNHLPTYLEHLVQSDSKGLDGLLIGVAIETFSSVPQIDSHDGIHKWL
ncbi:hypothetical protein HJFPF1_08610 [Paramyrothecium foliicola]|nr:hypothetical protein HJFPF1_08610 [Paramyrothecium foliicola]